MPDTDIEWAEYMGPGFVRITPLDAAGRRALWARTTPPADADGDYTRWPGSRFRRVELRAGREGDDARVVLRVGQKITAKDLSDLVDCLCRGRAYTTDDPALVLAANKPGADR